MNAILSFLLAMLPYMLIAIPFVALWRYLAVRRFKKVNIKTTLYHEIGLVLFTLFLVGLGSQTIIPPIYTTATGDIHILMGFHRYQIIPFHTFLLLFREGTPQELVINILGNVFMFIPIGFCIPLLFHKQTLWKTTLMGFMISLFIEVCQIPVYRVSDVDDLWMNTLGVFLGYLVFRLLRIWFSGFLLRFRVKDSSIQS